MNIKDPATGSVKPFLVTNATFSQLISESIDAMSLPVNKALELILSNSFGQTTFPITFSLQPNAVATANIQDGAVTTAKIPNANVTLSKLAPNVGTTPTTGDVITWGGSGFVLAPGGGGGPGGGISSLSTGEGIVPAIPNPITSVGTIAVDVSETGSSTSTKIPYFNNDSELVIDSTTNTDTRLVFSKGPDNYFIRNENSLKISYEDSPSSIRDLIIFLPNMGSSGQVLINSDLYVNSIPVCLSNGTNCPASATGGITAVTAVAPITASINANTLTIDANYGSVPDSLVKLGPAVITYPGVGTLPAVDGSNLLGVITDVLPGTATSVSKLLGNARVGVNFGPGNAQRWQPNLDNLGNLNTNDNFVIIGNGTSFEVQGGATLLASIGAQPGNANLTNLGSLSPLLGNIIVGGGASWNTQVIPNCASGNVILGNGSAFSCSNSSTPFSGGTFTTFNQPGLVIASPATGTTGELRFRGSNNTNYVGFQAAPGVVSDTIWSLPPTDGTSGFALTTNGAGTLGWTNVGGANDVSNATPTTDNAVARFDGTSGKIIQNSGVIIDDSKNVSGVANLSSAGTINNTGNIINSGDLTVDTNTLFVDSTNNRVGIGKTNPTQELDVTGNINGTGNLTIASNLAVDTNTLIVDSANNRVGIGTTTPVDFLNIFHTTNNFGGMTIGNSNAGTNSQSAINLMTLVGSTASIFNASNKGWHLTARGNSYATAPEQNDLLFAFNDLNTWRNILYLDSAAGNMTLMGALTINNNGSNSSTFPTGRGTAGLGLTTDGAGVLSWSNVGGANDISNAGASTDNAIARFDGTTGKLVQNSGVIIDDNNSISGVANFIAKGQNTNTPNAASTQAVDLMIGRNNVGALIAGQTTADISLEYGGGGFKHFISTQHNAAASSAQNAINFYLNNSNIAGDSTTPGTGNTIGASITQQGTGILLPLSQTPYAALDVVGNIYATIHGHTSLHDAAEVGARNIGMKSGNTGDGFTGMQLNVKATDSGGAALANTSDIRFFTWGNSIASSREVMRITERGRVGIGTGNPSEMLTLNGGNQLIVGNPIPTLTITGNTDNQQAGTIYLNQASNFGSYIFYNATDSVDGLVLANNRGGTTTNVLTLNSASSLIQIPQSYKLEFGAGVGGKEGSAGKIDYQGFDGSALGIVGAGTANFDRTTRFWDRVSINKAYGNGNLDVGGLIYGDNWFVSNANGFQSRGNGEFRAISNTNAAQNNQWLRGTDLNQRTLGQITNNQTGGVVGGNPENRMRFYSMVGGWAFQQWMNTEVSSPVQTTWAGALNAPAFTVTSDEREKEEIRDVSEIALDILNQLRIITYKNKKHAVWTGEGPEPDDGRQTLTGLSAQNLLNIYPKAVVYYKETDRYGVNLDSIFVLGIKAIKELSTKVNTLETENQNLKARLNLIEQRLGIQSETSPIIFGR